jgi:hypothetical protein
VAGLVQPRLDRRVIRAVGDVGRHEDDARRLGFDVLVSRFRSGVDWGALGALAR